MLSGVNTRLPGFCIELYTSLVSISLAIVCYVLGQSNDLLVILQSLNIQEALFSISMKNYKASKA